MKFSRLEILILVGILAVVLLTGAVVFAAVTFANSKPASSPLPATSPAEAETPNPETTATPSPTDVPPTLVPTVAPTVAPTSTSIPPTSVPTQIGTFNQPIPIGMPYEFPGFGTMTVVSAQWQPGQTGYAIAQLSFECNRPSNQICDTPDFMFSAVGSSGTSYTQDYDQAIPNPSFGSIFDGDLYGGGTENGYVGFLVTQPEDSLKMTVDVFLRIEDATVFFNLGP